MKRKIIISKIKDQIYKKTAKKPFELFIAETPSIEEKVVRLNKHISLFNRFDENIIKPPIDWIMCEKLEIRSTIQKHKKRIAFIIYESQLLFTSNKIWDYFIFHENNLTTNFSNPSTISFKILNIHI